MLNMWNYINQKINNVLQNSFFAIFYLFTPLTSDFLNSFLQQSLGKVILPATPFLALQYFFNLAMMESKCVPNQTFWDIVVCDILSNFLHNNLHLYDGLISDRTYHFVFEFSHTMPWPSLFWNSSHTIQNHMHTDTIWHIYTHSPSIFLQSWCYGSWISH